MSEKHQILGLATQGMGGHDEARLVTLLSETPTEWFEFRQNKKVSSFVALLTLLSRKKHVLVVMEGTGVAGGIALILGSLLFATPYIVSSGDAVGPYLRSRFPLFSPLFHFYEKLLIRRARGFIGWTPYLTGRALTLGCRRAMTAAGWNPHPPPSREESLREKLGVNPEDIVVGIVGSLRWNARVEYCYGLELIHAARHLKRKDVVFLIVGDGTGKHELEKRVGKGRFIFTGQVDRKNLGGYLSLMTLASLPQSADALGSFRYSTKLSEYLGAQIPIVTGQVPFAYDFGDHWLWRISGDLPWGDSYGKNLGEFLNSIDIESIQKKKEAIPPVLSMFDKNDQIHRVSSFVRDILRQEASH